MKIKVIPFIITFGIAALSGYTFYACNSGEIYNWLQFLLSGTTILIILEGGFGFSYVDKGGNNIVVTSILFAIADVIANLVFTFIQSFNVPAYIIVSGILTLLDIAAVYGLVKALK